MSYWFRVKHYGWGASPANWKGWLAITVFVALMFFIRVALKPGNAPVQVGASLLLMALFAWIAWKKTEGAWRWRWGSDGKEK
jgi:hypothetical protein